MTDAVSHTLQHLEDQQKQRLLKSKKKKSEEALLEKNECKCSVEGSSYDNFDGLEDELDLKVRDSKCFQTILFALGYSDLDLGYFLYLRQNLLWNPLSIYCINCIYYKVLFMKPSLFFRILMICAIVLFKLGIKFANLIETDDFKELQEACLLYTSPSPRDS